MKLKMSLFAALLVICNAAWALAYDSGVPAAPPGNFAMSINVDNGGYYGSVEEEVYEVPPPPPVMAPIMMEEHYHPHGMQWVNMTTGIPLPPHAFLGGSQPGKPHNLYVCRGYYRDGMHPGKWLAGYCNIPWGGREVKLSRYQVLTSKKPLVWLSAGYGRVPHSAVAGGDENGDILYICQADYHGGAHVGKLLGANCNFGWGGKEIITPNYRVLTAG